MQRWSDFSLLNIGEGEREREPVFPEIKFPRKKKRKKKKLFPGPGTFSVHTMDFGGELLAETLKKTMVGTRGGSAVAEDNHDDVRFPGKKNSQQARGRASSGMVGLGFWAWENSSKVRESFVAI